MKHVLIIHPEGNLFNNPTLKAIIELLLERGVAIDYCRYAGSDLKQATGIHFIDNSRLRRLVRNITLDYLHSRALFGLLRTRHIEFTQNKYDLLIGIDRHGLIEASMLSQITGAPLVFFSFEIMYEKETSMAYKQLEREFSADVRHWFVQDHVRAKDLERENGLNSANCTLLPLASTGPGTFSTDRLRDKLGVPPDKKVAMVVGSLANWTMIRELVNSLRDWPDDWVLVVHERYGKTMLELDSNDLSLNNRVYISTDAPDSVDDMGFVFSGVSAGLAFYRPDYGNRFTGRNVEHIGLSSGKISTYMRYAVPPVMNQIGIYAELAKANNFGLVVDHPGELGDALDTMDYSALSRNALDYYLNHLDFTHFREHVWQTLVDAASSS